MATIRMSEKEAIRCGLIEDPRKQQFAQSTFFGKVLLAMFWWFVGFIMALGMIR